MNINLNLLLGRYDLLDIFLPFWLVYVIFFAILQKTEVLGKAEKARPINALLSLVVATLVVFFTPFGISLVDFFTKFFTTTLIIGLGVFLFVVFANLIGIVRDKKSTLVLLISAILAFLVLQSTGIISGVGFGFQVSTSMLVGLAFIITAIFIIWILARYG